MLYLTTAGAFAALWLSLLLYNAVHLFVNYRQARRLGVPVELSPISPDNPLWIAAQNVLRGIIGRFPFDRFSFTRYCRLGWEFDDRYRTHLRLGDVWMLCTPKRNWLHVSEAQAASEIYARHRDFGRPVWMTEMLNVFGPSIATSDGQDWQRQRKLTATQFNERKSSLVWEESLRQARDMLRSWTTSARDSNGVGSTTEDVRTLALHVLAFVAFQRTYPFQSQKVSGSSSIDDRRPMTYRDSLGLILRNILVIVVVPHGLFSLPCLPTGVRQIGWAMEDFQEYMSRQIADERRLLAEGKPASATLVGNLVGASDVAQASTAGGVKGQGQKQEQEQEQSLRPLTIPEILGNIFAFNFAGHDTNSISLANGLFLLFAHEDVQDWIGEELRYYLPNNDPETWDYAEVFPKLKRCLAVLLETLRLYNPLLGTPKYTYAPQTLRVNGVDIPIPADTLVVPQMQSLHTHPRYWGDDSLVWRPSRWIAQQASSTSYPTRPPLYSSSSMLEKSMLEAETLLPPPARGAYVAWSEGARNCPGKKFAQVEFVAVLAALFHRHRADPVPIEKSSSSSGGGGGGSGGGMESLEEARKRVLGVVEDSGMDLLLQMKRPKSVKVVWREIAPRIGPALEQ